ncbi:MAG: polyprenyl synthetase family protein [Chloroflexi bacterium]|nr:polyprenyl synthetase family protein [Chloroflexota bacterium]
MREDVQPPEAFHQYRELIEAELRASLKDRGEALYRMMEYQLGWIDEQGNPRSGPPGKRLRPLLCLLVCEALGGEPRLALPLAAAVELVHNFSLIHDDIQDGNLERHHHPAVWWIWGPAQAINAGDGMHALARLSLLQPEGQGLPPTTLLLAIRALDQACLRLCEGQYLDISFQERLDVSVESYLRMVEGRTGALVGCALELGALAAGGEDQLGALLQQAGVKLGMAFQIRDDILDLWGAAAGKAAAGDILSKKKSLPVVFALERAPASQKRQLGSFYFKRVLEPADVPQIVSILDSLGAKGFCQEMALRFQQEALALLERSGISGERLAPLRSVAGFMVQREQ